VSGAGRGLKASSLFAEVDENFQAYGLLTHRHTAEMELALTHVAGGAVQVLFTPHLAPMTRGILATCYARPAVDNLTKGTAGAAVQCMNLVLGLPETTGLPVVGLMP
jgi:N-acetyl-gamma-glutamyl-phosphate reductase